MPFDWSKPLDAAPQRGLTGSQFSGAIDSYQANLYGLGEAVAPKGAIQDWMRSGRESNKFLAQEAAQRARALGAVDKFDDVNDISDFGSYAKSLAIGSLPYMGEMLAGGVVARGVSGGLRAAAGAGRTAGATEAAATAGRAAEKALATRNQAGALVAAYPSAVGDVLSAQRDAAPDGDTNLGSALAGGVVYDALNLLGVGGTLAKGGLARNTIRAFDEGAGFRAGAKRMGLTALRTGAEESLGETGQEMVNQSFGRMAVNPDETLFSDAALKRYKESAIGGFVLGGAFGSVGGYRRSQGYQPPSVAPDIENGQQGNLLQLGLDPAVRSPNEMISFPDGSTMTRAEYQATFADNPKLGGWVMKDGSQLPTSMSDLDIAIKNGDAVRQSSGFGPSSPVDMQRQEMLRAAVASGEITFEQAKQMGYVEAVNQPFQNAARAGEGLNTQSMVNRTTGVDRAPYAGKGYEQQFEAAASAPPDGSLTGEAQTRVPGEGQVEVPNTALDEVQRRAGLLNEQRLAEQQQAQEKAARAQRLIDLQLQPVHSAFLGQLDALVARNEITPEEVNFFASKVSQNIKPNEALTMAKTLAETRRKVVEGNLAPSAAEEVAAEIKAGGNGNIALAVAKDRQKQLNGELRQQQREAAQAAEKQRKETEKAAKQAAIDVDREKRNAGAPKAQAPKPTKPANVINAEAPKVDPSPAPVVPAPAVQPAAGPVVGDAAPAQPAAQTESVDGGAGGSALEPAVEGRGNAAVPVVVRKTRRVTKDGIVVGAETPAPAASTNTLFTKDEVERRREDRIKRNAGKLTAGIDPRDLADLAYEVGYYIELGVRSMAELMKKLVPQFGRGAIPHIRTAYARQLAKLGYEPTVVVGGVVDFSKLNDQLSDRPGYLRAARAVLGVDDEGYRINALSYAAAAQKYMGTKASGGTNLGAAMSKIGITAAVRAKTQLGRDVEVALPDIDLAMDPATLDEVVGKQEDTEAIDVQEQEKFDDRGVRLSDEEVTGDRGQEDALDANTDGLRQNSASSVGGSANSISANRKGLVANQKWYTEPMAKAEGDITRVPLADFATMGVKSIKFIDERNDPIKLIFMDELRRRMAGDMAGIAAAVRVAEKKEEANDKSTAFKPSGETSEDAGDAGATESDEEEKSIAGDDGPKYDAKTVIPEEKSDRLNAKEAREQAAAAEAVKARNKSVTITVNGVDREIGDAPSALAFANKKLADASLTPDKRAEYLSIQKALQDVMGGTTRAIGTTVPAFAKSGTPALAGGNFDGGKVVDGINAKLGSVATRVKLVGSFADLPQDVQDYAAENNVTPAQFRGITFNKQIYVTQDTHTSAQDLEETVFHELHGHIGVRVLFGNAIYSKLNTLYNRLGTKTFDELAAKYNVDAGYAATTTTQAMNAQAAAKKSAGGQRELQQSLLMGELLAHMAQKGGSFKRLALEAMGTIRAWLRDHGFANLTKVTESDLANILRKARNVAYTGQVTGSDVPMFSKAAPANAQSASPATVEATIQSLPVGLRPVARAVNAALGGYARRALNTINFTEDLLKRAAALGIKAADTYRQIANQRSSFVGAHERRVQAVTDMYDALPAALKGKGPGTANGFLYDSTQDEKWGYQPDYLTAKVDIDPAMKARFDAMPEGQAFIKAAFELGHYTLEEKKRIVIGHVASEYDALIANAKTPEEKKELGDKKLEADKQYGSLMKIGGNKPYSPIKRYGDWVVLAKSAEYEAAVAADDEALVKKLEKDPKHYYVDFVENEAAADALERELKQDTNYSDVVYRQKEKARDELFRSSGTLGAINKLRMQLDAEQGAKTDEDGKVMRSKEAEAMHRMLTDLYLGALAEASSRKSEMRRRGISGNIDMVRALETQGKADANFLGAIKFDAETNDALNAMRRDVRTGDNRNEKSEIFNEILMRHVQSLNYRPAGVAGKLTNLTSKWFLATSPAYYLQNATQPWMMSLPVMAGKHDYIRSAKALSTAYGNVAQAFKDSGLVGVVNFDKLLSKGNTALAQDEKDMLRALLDKGSIDIGMATELGQFRIESGGKASEAWNNVDSKLRNMQTKLEALNRVTTALAAYRLQKEKPDAKGGVSPAEYAEQIIDDTHGDYSAWNAPRAFNTELGRVALQFKKYQLIQLSLMAKLVTQAFGSAPKPEKVMARKALAYMFGQAMLVGGGRALPIAAPVAYMFAAAFGDGGDEPPEYVFRKMVGNKDIADLLVGGVPTLFGADLSKFGGMGQMLSVVPFTDINLADRKGITEVGFALLSGPLGGLAQRAAGGAGDLANGNIVKGLEGFLPTGASNILKAGRIYTQGIVQKDGDITMSPDEVTMMDTAMQAFGIRPERQAARQFRQNAEFVIDSALKQQSAEIKRNYTQAIKGGDQMAISEARIEWREYQERRDRLGFDRNKESDLLQAPKKQAEREKNTVGNVQYRDKSERFVRQLETL